METAARDRGSGPILIYWNAAAVRLREIHFVVMEDVETEERAFRTGLLHKTARMPPEKIEVYRREHPEELRIDPALGTYYYLLNINRPPLNDVRVRRAFGMTIDRTAIVEHVTHGGQRPAESFTPPGTGGYTPRAAIPYDPGKARELLSQAGYPGGRGFPEVDLLFNTNESHRLIAEAVQAMWKRELGIEVHLVNQEWKVFLDRISTGDFQNRARQLDRAAILIRTRSWKISSLAGRTTTADLPIPRYDSLLTQAGRTAVPAARLELFQEAEARLLAAAPLLPVYYYTHPYLMRTSVHGWEPNALDYHLYQNIWLEKTRETR